MTSIDVPSASFAAALPRGPVCSALRTLAALTATLGEDDDDAQHLASEEQASTSQLAGLLGAGKMTEAAHLLGHRFTVRHTVIAGRQLGRELGFPTANMKLCANTPLRNGVYAVRFRRADGALFDGVACLGRRPTVEADGIQLLETFVFDFRGDLYGEACSVSFFDYIRDEQTFSDLEALLAAMKRDEAKARAILGTVRPVSEIDAGLSF